MFSGYCRSVGPRVVSIVSHRCNQSFSTLFYVVFESFIFSEDIPLSSLNHLKKIFANNIYKIKLYLYKDQVLLSNSSNISKSPLKFFFFLLFMDSFILVLIFYFIPVFDLIKQFVSKIYECYQNNLFGY